MFIYKLLIGMQKKIRRHPMQMLINCCSEGDNRGALLLPKKASRQRNKNVALIQPQVKERSCCLLSRYWETCAESIPNQKNNRQGIAERKQSCSVKTADLWQHNSGS